jgi:hypothetical protein
MSQLLNRKTSEMRTYTLDLNSLFRSSVGFNRIGRLLNAASNTEAQTYSSNNIEKLDD